MTELGTNSQPTKPSSKVEKGGGHSFWVLLALPFFLILIALGYFLFQGHREQMRSDRHVEKIHEEVEALRSQLAVQHTLLEAQKKKLTRYENLTDPKLFILSEAQGFIRHAIVSLQFNSKALAQQALGLALDVLKINEADNKKVIDVIESYQKKLQAGKIVPISDISARVYSLEDNLAKLQPNVVNIISKGESEESSDGEVSKQSTDTVDKAKGLLSKLVLVQHHQDIENRLTARQQMLSMQTRANNIIQQIVVSAQQHDESQYREAIRQLQRWVEQNYSKEDKDIKTIERDIRALSRVNVALDLEGLLVIQKMLTEAQHESAKSTGINKESDTSREETTKE